MLGARPFDRSLMTPINATDMQRYSPQHRPYVSFPGIQLRTPSSFAMKNSYAKHPLDSQNKQQNIIATNDNKMSNAEEYNCSLANVSNVSSDVARSQPVEGKFHNNLQHTDDVVLMNERGGLSGKMINSSIPLRFAEQEIVPAREMHISRNFAPLTGDGTRSASKHSETHKDTTPYSLIHSKVQNSDAVSIAECMLADALLPPSAIHANDIIRSTLDEEGLMYIREKLADKYNAVEKPVLHRTPKSSQRLDTSNVSHPRSSVLKENNNPANANEDAGRAAAIAAMKNPASSFTERTESNNAINTPLEANRKIYKPLSHVIQPTAPVDYNEQKQHDWLLAHTAPDNVLGACLGASLTTNVLGTTTENASDPLSNKCEPADAIISASSPSSQINFQYPVNPLQAELNSSLVQPTVLYSEQLHNQVFPHNIVGDVNVVTQQNAQHVEHLKNAMEDLRIDSTRTQKCRKCHEDIRVGEVIVTAEKANNASWHPGCFVCSVCNELLVDLVYFHYKNELYCARDLSAHLGIPRCFACDEVIKRNIYRVFDMYNSHVLWFLIFIKLQRICY